MLASGLTFQQVYKLRRESHLDLRDDGVLPEWYDAIDGVLETFCLGYQLLIDVLSPAKQSVRQTKTTLCHSMA